jgi:hypothetical protein
MASKWKVGSGSGSAQKRCRSVTMVSDINETSDRLALSKEKPWRKKPVRIYQCHPFNSIAELNYLCGIAE